MGRPPARSGGAAGNRKQGGDVEGRRGPRVGLGVQWGPGALAWRGSHLAELFWRWPQPPGPGHPGAAAPLPPRSSPAPAWWPKPAGAGGSPLQTHQRGELWGTEAWRAEGDLAADNFSCVAKGALPVARAFAVRARRRSCSGGWGRVAVGFWGFVLIPSLRANPKGRFYVSAHYSPHAALLRMSAQGTLRHRPRAPARRVRLFQGTAAWAARGRGRPAG